MRSRLLRDDSERLKGIRRGRHEPVTRTGVEFGFDLAAWRDLQLTFDEFGYRHPYAFEPVDRVHGSDGGRGTRRGPQVGRLSAQPVPAGSTSIPERTAELVGSLTPRERQVLSLVASGLSSKDIARAMELSVRTVESHRARVNAKLGVRTVAGLTKVAMGAGLTSLVVDTRPRA